MPTVVRFEEIEAWKTARELTRLVYALTGAERFSKDFGPKGQIQRGSVSVMSNIAEGFESRTTAQFIDYLGRAKASAGEVRCQLYVGLDLGYLSEPDSYRAFDLVEKAYSQVARFINYLVAHPQARQVREDRPAYEA